MPQKLQTGSSSHQRKLSARGAKKILNVNRDSDIIGSAFMTLMTHVRNDSYRSMKRATITVSA